MAVRLGLVGDDGPEHETNLSIEDAAEQLNVSRATVFRMIADGRLAAIKHAGRRKIQPSAIAEYRQRIEAEAELDRAEAELATRRPHGTPLPPLPRRGGKSTT